ncbi:serine/threonine-protein kinase [Streptomyces sp. SL13]|uniref:non-specific serine/threonine protein kinase n=1 Tax=Streptantibioticus silvisoli TaxID=2705255 RepID=A0AA90KB19_9ACTN|nr:serine/threonine-protein kinase [Streptantibioticus silvisoli]MDI5972747.1 serine/threonine-protein kinase [Streptantibioticus silvisoli]
MARQGDTVAGRYLLGERIGYGGMGTVWRATDRTLNRQVAVKELRVTDEPSEDDRRVQADRALREARSAARIKHPNVVTLHDVIVGPDERPWLVMELVEGRSLGQLLSADGPLPPREAARVGAALASALGAAHARGVLHRDVKPANVLLERGTGRVVLTDFGIAQLPDGTALTVAGEFVGSPEYTAPERMTGEPATPACDMWSLGVLLYAAVTGRSPFRRDAIAAVLHAVLHAPVIPPPGTGRLGPVIGRLLERDAAARPAAPQAARLLASAASAPEPEPERPAPAAPDGPPAPPTAEAAAASRTVSTPSRPNTVPRPAAPRADTPSPDPTPSPSPALSVSPAPSPSLSSTSSTPPPTPAPAAPAPSSAPTPPPTPPPVPRRGSRVAGAVAAAVVLLAAGGTAGVLAAWHGGGGDRARGTPSDAAHPPGSGTAPAGFRYVHDAAGFALDVPDGFTRSPQPPRVFYLSAGQAFRLGIRRQKPDASGPYGVMTAEADAAAHPSGTPPYPGYRDGSVTRTTHAGQAAAQWEFTWNGFGDGPRRTYDLCWNRDGVMWDVWVSAPLDRLDDGLRYFDAATGSFTSNG